MSRALDNILSHVGDDGYIASAGHNLAAAAGFRLSVHTMALDPEVDERAVIVPARDEEQNIARCLESLVDQSYTNYEIIVLDAGRIAESHVIIDTLDVMRQAGYWPIAPSLGTEAPWPSPATCRGGCRPRSARAR